MNRLGQRWLRDVCQCSRCVHPSTNQKLHRSSDILEFSIVSQSNSTDGIHVTWNDDRIANFHHQISTQPWSRQSIQNSPSLFVTYSSLSSTRGLVTATEQIVKYGILFVTDVPNTKTSDDECELRTLAEKFGYIRPTFYGTMWNVVNIRNSKNIAYTNLHLDLHMDLLYFHHPPQYQILHCLRNKVLGGSSFFVDAFHIAETLRENSPSSFKALATTPVPFQYINDGHHLYHAHPTIELDPLQEGSIPLEKRSIKYVNYSPPFQAPFLRLDGLEHFYASLRSFTDLLDAEENRYEYTMREGDAVLFDNRRVLHARTAFTDIPGAEIKEGDTNRWLKGCYLDDDAILDRYRVMKAKLDV